MNELYKAFIKESPFLTMPQKKLVKSLLSVSNPSLKQKALLTKLNMQGKVPENGEHEDSYDPHAVQEIA